MHIVGTAGHVDHGKSALVRALTGTDPDRWLEEQQRGMTLDLGFAHLRFPDGREAGIIDVPGHERFLHNMLAGAAGMEIVLLVVAANEGVRPQTLEHLALLQYLNVKRTLIALTKADLLAAAELASAATTLRTALRGTLAATAPLYAVSAHSGAGLDDLRSALGAVLADLPERAPHAPAYLPIDRVFALAGHGTIVTGTLMQGRVAAGDALRLSPLGRDVRVRSLQVFGEKRDAAGGGTRVALNLPGVDRGEIARGAVLASPEFPLAADFAVRFRPLADALELLRRRTPVRVYLGADEILGTLVCATPPRTADEIDARLHLRRPTVGVPGAPFVLRRLSPMDVLGGGTLGAARTADTDAEAPAERQATALLVALRGAGLGGATPAQLSATANLDAASVRAALDALLADGRAVVLAKPPAYLAGDLAGDVLDRARATLDDLQRQRPWVAGVTSLALANALGISEPTLMRILAVFVEAGRLVYRGGYYATIDFTPRLSAEQRTFFDAAFAAEPANHGAPVAFDRLRAEMRASRIPELGAAFETLIASGSLSKVGEFVYRGSDLRKLRGQLEAALQAHGQITVAQFRDATGTSRKYAVPLLEFFDAAGVTIRSGDVRTLRRRPAGANAPSSRPG